MAPRDRNIESDCFEQARRTSILMPAFDDFPIPFPVKDGPSFAAEDAGESLAATLAEMFAACGDDFAVGLLVNAKHRIEQQRNNFGEFWKYRWLVNVPPPLYALYKKQEEDGDIDFRDDFIARAWQLGGPLMEDLSWRDIAVSPVLSTDSNWRNLKSERLGPLPLINHFLRRSGLEELLDSIDFSTRIAPPC